MAWQSVTEKKSPPAAPLATIVAIAARVSSSNTGGPGTGSSARATSSCPGRPTVSQRKPPISGTVTSARTSMPSFSV